MALGMIGASGLEEGVEPDVDVTVVIAVHNGARTLGAQLLALTEQVDPPRFEVLIMDNNSTDDLVSLVAEFSGELYVRLEQASMRQGASYARNHGALLAKGSHLLFCDADDVVGERWVRALHEELAKRPALVTGPVELSYLNDELLRRLYAGEEKTVRPYAIEGYLPFAFGANMGTRRSDYLALGGMDNSYKGGHEDVDFAWRAQEAGLPLILVEDATVHYRLRSSPRAVLRQRRGYARGRVITWLRSRDGSRPLKGMSLRWAIRNSLRLPLAWLASRTSRASRLSWAARAGDVLGNLEGQLRYRVFGKVPRVEMAEASGLSTEA